jgi:hypothetical protein
MPPPADADSFFARMLMLSPMPLFIFATFSLPFLRRH